MENKHKIYNNNHSKPDIKYKYIDRTHLVLEIETENPIYSALAVITEDLGREGKRINSSIIKPSIKRINTRKGDKTNE